MVNREQEPIEANPRVQECLSAAKDVRNHLVRYIQVSVFFALAFLSPQAKFMSTHIQLVEDEELIGTLLETNERIIQALEMYDQASASLVDGSYAYPSVEPDTRHH